MIRESSLALGIAAATMIAACGGGGGGGGGGDDFATPRSTAEAVQQQSAVTAELDALVDELIQGNNAANDALDQERYADFDAYWREDYPDWVDRFSAAVDRFAQVEQDLVALALTAEARSAVARAGEAGGVPAKVVPAPVVLVAIAVMTGIAVKERERKARLNDGVDAQETEAIIESRAAYLRAKQGLNEIQARVRAQVDVAQVEILRGLKNGIEHAQQFVRETATNIFAEYLPELPQTVVGLIDDGGKLLDIRDNTKVLLTDPACGTSVPQQSMTVGAKALEAFPVCRVVFCDPQDLQCGKVPPGDWSVSLFSPEYLRDEARVTVLEGEDGTATFVLFSPEEADAANGDPGGNGNGGNLDFSRVFQADFSVRLRAGGTLFDYSDFSSQAQTREVSGSGLSRDALQTPIDCPRIAGLPGIPYVFRTETVTSTGSQTQTRRISVTALLDAGDCLTLESGFVTSYDLTVDSASGAIRTEESLELQFDDLPGTVIRNSDGSSRVLYQISGASTCNALVDDSFDYFAVIQDQEFVGEQAQCDSDSYFSLNLRME